MSPRLETAQNIAGHVFQNPALLEQALTHSSVNHNSAKERAPNNERLEFLGDAVLQLALSEWLYERLQTADEGALTKLRAQLVSTRALARLSRQLGLGSHMLIGRGEEAVGGRENENILADVVEAVLGAIYLDGGLAAAQGFVRRHFAEALDAAGRLEHEGNPKGCLQEICQTLGPVNLRYEIIAESGLDHAKNFTAAVLWDDEPLGTGTGASKKEAEIRAASAALESEALQSSLKRRGAPIIQPP
ncbi:MAG TPA: ribonuclease III [Verrucomicrobiales bacterium]|mgnify:CR=1 FL=1|nr:ribonuclease III [Verrucomicrobiales bacterium]